MWYEIINPWLLGLGKVAKKAHNWKQGEAPNIMGNSEAIPWH
jgi:hypothetical protein